MAEPPEAGTCLCMSCQKFFVSPDPERIRRCTDCKQHEDGYQPPLARLTQVDWAVYVHFRDTT